MATTKSFSDLEQSKKLAEILPLESADNVIVSIGDREGIKTITIPKETLNILRTPFTDIRNTTPCWSLAALRNLLPPAIKPNKDTYLFESHNTFDNSWVYRYYNENDASYLYCKDISEVDACFKMIIKLKENRLI